MSSRLANPGAGRYKNFQPCDARARSRVSSLAGEDFRESMSYGPLGRTRAVDGNASRKSILREARHSQPGRRIAIESQDLQLMDSELSLDLSFIDSGAMRMPPGFIMAC